MNKIDPSQPVHPLRRTKCYPVPPVCTVLWTEEDWDRTAFYVSEQEVIETAWGPADAVGRGFDGVLLYTIRSLAHLRNTPQP